MYQQQLLALSRDPGHRAHLDAAEIRAAKRNPACGDEVALAFDLEDGRLARLRYQAQGCAISLASAHVLCVALEGLDVGTAQARIGAALAFFDRDGDWTEGWGGQDLPALGAVRAHPMRLHCARLPWLALRDALRIA
jgi:nitrogen fixation NifU-like protein